MNKKFIIYIGGVLSGLGIAFVFSIINKSPDYWGTVADWVTGLITIGAFIWSIISISKQTNFQRALNIESQRPRFSYELSAYIRKGDIVLRPTYSKKTTLNEISKRIQNKEGYVVRINNFSNNYVSSIKMILHCDDECVIYSFHGLSGNRSIVLIPNKFLKKWDSLYVKFRTAANEIGYMYCSVSVPTKYYFVKGNNSMVTVNDEDKIISKNADIVKKFDKMFNSQKPGMTSFIAEKDVKYEKV